jgi:hypothetical protein
MTNLTSRIKLMIFIENAVQGYLGTKADFVA